MLKEKKQHLINQLREIEAVKNGEFVLKSGRTSSVYVDLRRVISFPEVLNNLVDLAWETIKDVKSDVVCGVPYGAIPYASVLCAKYNKPLLMMRKEAKAHGTKQLVEGHYEPQQHCLVIEDVITTGGSLVNSVEHLKEAGLKVSDVLCIVDRQEGARELLESKGYRVHSLLTLNELTTEQSNEASNDEKSVA